jgi:structural maintenance of chromosome 3 (chondroitin sulfate proteoglycan 6)
MTLTHRTKLELSCEELREMIRTGEENLASNQKELEQVEKDIRIAQTDLQDRVQPKFDELKEALARATHDKDEAVKRMQGLYAKQGRGKQFRTREARDLFLQSQINELTSILEDKHVLLKEKEQTMVNLRRTVTTGLKDTEKKGSEASKKQAAISELTKEIDDAKRKRNELAEIRKEQWRALDELNEKVLEAREVVKQASSAIRKIIPRNTAMGLDALSSIVAEEGIIVGTQYFGLVLQNFEVVDTKFQTAIEVAANNALFHVIVDTDTTAARLMKKLEQDKLGRVTFLPLNQLNIDNLQYPDSPDVFPILQKCIRYDPKIYKAMQHVFGKKLLARNVEIAATWSAQSNMDTITLDGDLCSRKGALSGGFVDVTKRLVLFFFL